MKEDNPETILSEMLKSIRDLLALLGIFTVMLATLGYAWGYFA